MERIDLPAPTTYEQMYMHDQCLSLRALVDLLTPAPQPAADTVELREPSPAPNGQGEGATGKKVQSSTRARPSAK